MKKTFRIISIALFNLVLIYLAYLIHYEVTVGIINTTDIPNGIGTYISTPILLIGLFFFFVNKKFRLYSVGVTVICMSIFFYLFFNLNRSLAQKGEYESFKLREALWLDNGFFLNIAFNKLYNSTEVTLEKCMNVDSVQVRIDNGFFGMRTMTKNVKIVEGLDCEHENLDTNNLTKSYLNIGHTLAIKRCFPDAIDYYSICINLDSLNYDCYYHRGLMFMATEEYDKALIDFYTSATIKYQQLDNKTTEFIDNVDLKSYQKKLLNKIENEDYIDIGEYFANIKTIHAFDIYHKRIKFCINKIREE